MLCGGMPREHDRRPGQHPALAVAAPASGGADVSTLSYVEFQAPEHATAALRTETVHKPMVSPALLDHAPLHAGATLKHYEIIRKLGEGGMGAVFLARDTRLGRLVAVKVLLPHGGTDAERFLAEARATARCKHENIVVIHEVDEARGA